MSQILRQSTQIKVVIGPVVAVGDGFTPVTTLSLASADEAEIIKSDAGSVTDISGATFAAITSADGYYNLTLTTSHTDTVGLMTVLINDDSLCLPVKATFQVVEEAVYDALYAASAAGYQVPIWASAGSTVNLSATTIKTATDVETDTADIQSRLPAALVGGKMDSDATAISGSTTAANNAEIVFDTDFASNYNATADKWNVSVTHFGGTPGTFSSGRPEVNTTHWGGTAVASATVNANVASVGSNTACIVNIVDVFDTSFGSTWNGTDGMWVVDLRKIQGVAVAYSSGTFDFDILETAYGAVNTNLDAAITSRMATYTQPTGFLAATFPTTVASTTNITAGTITTVTNLTNAPTSGDLTATMKASVNAEVDAAIETYHLDHLLATTYDPASKPGAADALLNELVENDGGVARYTANALEQAPSGGGGTDWTADERTAIRSILGIPASGTTPDDPTTGILDTIRDNAAAIKVKTDYLPSATAGAAGGVFIAGSNAATTVDITGNITGNLSGSVGSISGITFPTNFGSTVISAGGVVSADTVAVSGDTTAADNLESYLDGTNFMPVDAHKPVFSISGATLTVKRPDGTTTAYTRTLTTDAAADPVTGSS